jgi:peptidoglycan/LPS O-acetylase OafA/YrhL
MSDEARDSQLDGLRGLAVLAVVLFHASFYAGAPDLGGRLAFWLPAMGWSGVDLFFVLSGFLITRILLAQRDAPNYYRAFYGRRVLRIFPLYYALLFGCFFVVPMVATSNWNEFWFGREQGESLWYWLYASNWYNALEGTYRHRFLNVAWSLAIEEQFYLVWPFVVRACSPRALERICGVVIVGALLGRLAAVAAGWSDVAVYVLTPLRLDTIAVGAFIALRSQRAGGFSALAAQARWVLPLAGVGVLGLGLAIQIEPRLWTDQPGRLLAHPVMQTVGFSAVAAAYGSLVILCMNAEPAARLRRGLEASWLRAFGRYSYAIYLLHVPVIFMFSVNVWNPGEPGRSIWLTQLVRYAAAIGGSFLLAALSWRLLESPLLRLRRHFPYHD